MLSSHDEGSLLRWRDFGTFQTCVLSARGTSSSPKIRLSRLFPETPRRLSVQRILTASGSAGGLLPLACKKKTSARQISLVDCPCDEAAGRDPDCGMLRVGTDVFE